MGEVHFIHLFSDDNRPDSEQVLQFPVGFGIIAAQQHCLLAGLLAIYYALVLVKNPDVVLLVN